MEIGVPLTLRGEFSEIRDSISKILNSKKFYEVIALDCATLEMLPEIIGEFPRLLKFWSRATCGIFANQFICASSRICTFREMYRF